MTRFVALLSLLLLCTPAPAGDWAARFEKEVTIGASYRHAPVFDWAYHFWGAGWRYAGTVITWDDPADPKTFIGQVRSLGLKLTGTVKRPAADTVVIRYRIDALRDIEGVIGGGLHFNLALDSPAIQERSQPPVLLPDHRGFKWSIGEEAIEVTFEPPVANVYIEPNMVGAVRAQFVGDKIAKGHYEHVMTLKLPQGVSFEPTLAARYGPANLRMWHRGALPPNEAPLDLSFLNDNHLPAGRHGVLRSDGDRLVFDDGTPARFWGCNVAAYALFDKPELIKLHAKRIAQLGYNLVRIHHHDSTRWVNPTVIDGTKPDSQQLNKDAMDLLNLWVHALKQEGVYVWIDLHVGRQFKPGDELGDGWSEIERTHREAKGFNYFNERVRHLMQAYNEQFLTYPNPHTELAYKDDPAVVGLLITNENDITHHFGHLMLADKNNPYHTALFEAELLEFTKRTKLPIEQTRQTWVPGPAMIFLNEMERKFNRAMIGHLVGVGARSLVATTNFWGEMTLASLPALYEGSIIDAHSYGQSEALSTNPRYRANFISWIGAAQVYGRPLAITEWNVPYPAVDRFIAPMYVMSMASLQGWDMPMIYNYSQRPFGPHARADMWSTYEDPAFTAVMPAAAVAFRRGHVKQATQTYCLQLDEERLYAGALSPKNSATLRTLVEKSRLVIGLPETARKAVRDSDIQVLTDPHVDHIDAQAQAVVSDTGEIRRDWVSGVQTIDTPRTQAVQGWMGGETLSLSAVEVRLKTAKAVVVVTSLDDRPIRQSRRLLLTTVARCSTADGNRLPFRSEPVLGELTIASEVPGLHLYLPGQGNEGTPLERSGDRYLVELPAVGMSHWALLTP